MSDDDAAPEVAAAPAGVKKEAMWHQRPKEERVMEAVLMLRRGRTKRSAFQVNEQSGAVSVAQVESQLRRRAEETKQLALAREKTLSAGDLAALGDVSWARDVLARLQAQNAVENVNDGAVNITPMYRVTDAAAEQIQSILAAREAAKGVEVPTGRIPTEAGRRQNKAKHQRKKKMMQHAKKRDTRSTAAKKIMRETHKLERLHAKHHATQRRNQAKFRKK